jgi:hypothetical protein
MALSKMKPVLGGRLAAWFKVSEETVEIMDLSRWKKSATRGGNSQFLCDFLGIGEIEVI